MNVFSMNALPFARSLALLDALIAKPSNNPSKTAKPLKKTKVKQQLKQPKQPKSFPSAVKDDELLPGPMVDADANFLDDTFMAPGMRRALLDSARAVGVTQFVSPVVTLEDCEAGLKLAREHPGEIYVTAGVHPYWAAREVGGGMRDGGKDFSEAALEELAVYAAHESVRCVGECGLDLVRGPGEKNGFPSLEAQLPWFKAQVELACKLQKPLFLHVRDAFGPFIEIMEQKLDKLPSPAGLVHAFTGTEEDLVACRALDCFIGVTGFICKKSEALRNFLPLHVPLDRLVIETDAPYMGFKGCRSNELEKPKDKNPNVPSALPMVARAVAECYGVPVQEIVQRTTKNARLFFRMEA